MGESSKFTAMATKFWLEHDVNNALLETEALMADNAPCF